METAIKQGDKVATRLGGKVVSGIVVEAKNGRYKTDIGGGQILTLARKDLVDDLTAEDLLKAIEPDIPAAPVGFDLPASYSALDQSDPDAEEAKLYIIDSEWSGSVERGDSYYEAAEPYIKNNPDKEFRWLGPIVCSRHGNRDYQTVKDPKTGKPVMHGVHTLGYIPKPVYQERRRRALEDANEIRQVKADQNQEIIDRAAAASRGGIRDIVQRAEYK